MEQFDIVLALAGLALETENPRAIQQVERLREALAKSDKEQAAKLARVLECLTKPVDLPDADDGAGKLAEGHVDVGAALVTDSEASELAEPGEGAFDMR